VNCRSAGKLSAPFSIMTETLWRLHALIISKNLGIVEALNIFDDACLVSNHIVTLSDISDVDAEKCIEFLNEEYPADKRT